ncbi:MAG: DUF2953 domain-containing protein [Pseudomonadota bacterium]
MAVALTVILWAFLFVLVAALAALAVPWRVEISAQMSGDVAFIATLRPFGAKGPAIPLRGGGAKKQASTKDPKRPKRPARGGQRVAVALPRLLLDVLGCFRIDLLRVEGRIGTGDPAETGQLYGYLSPLAACAGALPRAEFQVVPVFDRAVFEGQARAVVTFVPFRLLPPLWRFARRVWGPVW